VESREDVVFYKNKFSTFYNFFKFLSFPLKSSEILVGLRSQLASVTINFTDNRDYGAVLYSLMDGNRGGVTEY
jgi:hypothetical protein